LYARVTGAAREVAQMAFIRRKRTTAGHVYQVVRSSRVAGRVRQEVLVSLGSKATLGELLAELERRIGQAERLREVAAAGGVPGATDWLDQQLHADRTRAARLLAVQRETGLP
jgi:hypothetical protein